MGLFAKVKDILFEEEEVTEPVKKTKEEKKEVKAAPKKAETVDLSTKTVAELREMAKAKEIKGYSTMKKAELIEVLG